MRVRISTKYIMWFVLLSSLSIIGSLKAATITPSHVYQQTENIKAEISLIRRALNITHTPRQPPVPVNKKPIHVFAKSLEVLEKVSQAQANLGLMPGIVGEIPVRKITPAEVNASCRKILVELRKLKTKKGIVGSISESPFVGGKTPTNVYENLWRASYMMDGITGPIKPSYVYRNAVIIARELQTIADKMGKHLSGKTPASIDGKKPKQVNLEGFKNLHKLSKLQRSLSMAAFRVHKFPAGKVMPSDVYDTTNNLMAELVRVKVKLGISHARPNVPLEQGKNPADVFAQMQRVGHYLDQLI